MFFKGFNILSGKLNKKIEIECVRWTQNYMQNVKKQTDSNG